MEAVEPNVSGALVFAVACVVTALAFYIISGMYPVSARPAAARGRAGSALVAANTVLFAVVLGSTAWQGWSELRWTSLVIIAAFGFLFAPSIFELWPVLWRDSRRGLVVLAAAQAAVVSGLAFAMQT